MHLSTGIQQFKITIYYNAVKPKAEATITADQMHYFFENIILHCVSQIVNQEAPLKLRPYGAVQICSLLLLLL